MFKSLSFVFQPCSREMLLPHTCIKEIEMSMVKQQDCTYRIITDGIVLLSNVSGHQTHFHSRCDLKNSLALQVKEVKSSESFKRGLEICIAAKNTWSYRVLCLFVFPFSMPLCSIQILLYLKQMGSGLWELRCHLQGHKLS